MPQTHVELKRSTPESVGLASKNILAFVNATESAELELHSLMILKDHQVVAEGWWTPYRRDDVHLLYSLSKSFTSTAIGFAVQEGLVDIDAPVISYFPDQAPENPSDNLKAMKVRHLLSMSSGHATDDMSVDMTSREDGDWVRGFLGRDVVYDPGTHFLYNNGASYTLSAIVSKVTGMSALDYLRPRLFDPLGVEKATWTTCPKGICIGASQLCITTETIARFGLLYLDRGMWNGERLLSEAWIDQATSFQVPNSSGG
ncbi:MAG: serine hydrolase domain-containing protein, partial [Polyangiaceae bacterium]